jgi:hypothetical protein
MTIFSFPPKLAAQTQSRGIVDGHNAIVPRTATPVRTCCNKITRNAHVNKMPSLLVGEAAQALGLHGFEATAFNTVAGSVTTQLMRNAYGIISAGGDLTEASLGQMFNAAAHRCAYARRRRSPRVRGMQPRAVARKTHQRISPTKCMTRDICP